MSAEVECGKKVSAIFTGGNEIENANNSMVCGRKVLFQMRLVNLKT